MTDITGNLHTIAAGRPFADDLAAGIMRLAPAPQDLADALILLPSRRSAAALRAAFLRALGGKAALLPEMAPLGDLAEDAPELAMAGWDDAALRPMISRVERQLRLAMQIKDDAMPPGDALSKAAALGDFLDAAQTAGCDMEKLGHLVGDDTHGDAELAGHWQKLLKLLSLLVQYWPLELERLGKSDPVRWRDAALRARSDAWQKNPPQSLVVIAGSTGSHDATRMLMQTCLTLPRGHVVLPGLDTVMDDAEWQSLTAGEDATAICHPQYQIAKLLGGLGKSRADVSHWPHAGNKIAEYDAAATGRLALLAEIFRPATQTGAWQTIPDRAVVTRESLDGLRIAEAADAREEAETIALAMREVLEVPGKTAALVTADRVLARMVAGELARWGIAIEDSSGRALTETHPAQFIRLIADAWAQDFAPMPLLAMLQHRLASGGIDKSEFRRMTRRMDMELLRGMHGGGGDALKQYARRAEKELKDKKLARFIDENIAACLAPLTALAKDGAGEARLALAGMLDALAGAAENLAATDDDPLALWQGQEGMRCGKFLRGLTDAARGAGMEITPAEMPAILTGLLAGETIHTSHARHHPRLAILGQVEARMHNADLFILGGMNEGTAPPRPAPDPWMSAAMREDFGLPPVHWRSGPAAHDAYMVMAAPQVLMTRARRRDGAPTEMSRWLRRLDAVLDVARYPRPVESGLGRLAARLVAWEGPLAPIAAPRPVLDAATRPREFSATAIDTLITDPYAIYARKVLGLKPLDALDAPPDAATRGSFIHDALKQFLRRFPTGALPDDALAILLADGRAELAKLPDSPWVEKFWWPQFETIARWFIAFEKTRQDGIKTRHAEVTGSMEIAGRTAPYTITARADRIDTLQDGSLRIIDYKTGLVPEMAAVQSGRAWQLRIEAMLAGGGHVSSVAAGEVAALEYWRLTGRGSLPGTPQDRTPDPATLKKSAEDIAAILHDFDRDDAAYVSERLKTRHSDYRHFARIREWRFGDGDDGGAG